MADITLGAFTFDGTTLEVPAEMATLTKQHTARHWIPGGTVTIDALGPDWGPIKWKGFFQGPDAQARRTALKTAVRQGHLLPLTWLDQTFQVMVDSITVHDRLAFWIPYQITCTVVSDGDQTAQATQPSLAQQTTADTNSAASCYAGWPGP